MIDEMRDYMWLKYSAQKISLSKLVIPPLLGKQRALSLDIWPVPNIDSAIGYFCV